MKTYTTDELKEILRLHRLWRIDEEGGSEADLSWADFSEADLSWADLSGANLSRADLSRADFSEADLSGANLSGADLSWADFSEADLSWADFSGANLSGADLSGADLSWADFSEADLSGALGLAIATDAPARLLAVAHAALASPDALAMGAWHTCETTHCICGWAEHLGGPLANLIIEIQGNDVGGLMLLGVEAHAHFYKTNDEARAFLQSVIDKAEAVK